MKKILALSLLILALAACGIDNTMYNAQNYFQSAQERALNANGRPSPQAVDEYTKAIRKCGMILSANKNSKRADDALFLMARALYYKGNSAFQAKDAFQSLINGYPDSKFVPEAHIYLAKVLRDINQPQEAEAHLEQFIRNPKFIKHHPRALLVLADFELQDEDYLRAQYWLQKIITDYRKTDEFKEAFFLFGKNYYLQKDYSSSLAEFRKFLKTRGISKDLKLEAQYYIALNQYELGAYDDALRTARYLIRDEIRPDALAASRVLYGRILLVKGEIEDGIYELEDVGKKYPRTEQAASAYYYWGRYLYYQEGKIDEAITHLNKVRTEYSASPYAEEGKQLAAALAQVKTPASLDSEVDLQAFLDHHYLRAESFISPLALPDSALASYERVIAEYDSLLAQRDSLSLEIQELNASIDSLDSSIIPLDSLAVNPVEPEAEGSDSLAVDLDEPDALLPEAAIDDSLDSVAMADSVITLSPAEQRAQSVQKRDALQSRLDNLPAILTRFETEVLPFSYFSIYSILHKVPGREEETGSILQLMQEHYPRNMYTRAALAMQNGNTPRLVDPDLEAAEQAFDAALDYYPAAPDSLLTQMLEFRESPYAELRLRANYRLAWHYSFEAPDTTLARGYLDAVLEHPESGDYGSMIRRFYDGTKYLLRDSGLPDSLAVSDDPDSAAVLDSLAAPDIPVIADSLALEIPPADSLSIAADSLSFEIPPADSLLLEPAGADSLIITPVEAGIDSLAGPESPGAQIPPNNPEEQPEEPEPQDVAPAIKEEEQQSE